MADLYEKRFHFEIFQDSHQADTGALTNGPLSCRVSAAADRSSDTEVEDQELYSVRMTGRQAARIQARCTDLTDSSLQPCLRPPRLTSRRDRT